MGNNGRRSTTKRTAKPKVRFSNGPAPGSKRGGGSNPDPTGTGPSRKKQRTNATAGGSSPAGSSSQPPGPSAAPAADSAPAAGDAAAAAAEADGDDDNEAPAKKRVCNPWGIRPKEVAPEAKPTQVCLSCVDFTAAH
jgi:hypothetical protein